jgi:hypothetical protein
MSPIAKSLDRSSIAGILKDVSHMPLEFVSCSQLASHNSVEILRCKKEKEALTNEGYF